MLLELASRGHEIALHVHEDAHLGRNADALAPQRWIDVVNGQLAKITMLGIDRVRMWSGGNLYPHLLEVAAATGLDVKADWKNPKTQTADPVFRVSTPWRPAGSPSETDLTAFLPSVRSKADQDRIWAQYERLVAWAAANLRVVTSEDLVALAKS